MNLKKKGYDLPNSITFPSNRFSKYTIVKVSDEVTDPQEDNGSSDSSSESSSGSDSSSDSSSGDETAADPEGTVTIPTEVIGETTLPAEEVKALGVAFEGSAFHVPLKGKLIPVYRMFCSKVAAGAHRFVEDETEVARLEATGNWVKEGIAWYTIAK